MKPLHLLISFLVGVCLSSMVFAQIAVVAKQCGKCGKEVSISSQAGMRCPHCGVYWSFENNQMAKSTGGMKQQETTGTAHGGFIADLYTREQLEKNASGLAGGFILTGVVIFALLALLVKWVFGRIVGD